LQLTSIAHDQATAQRRAKCDVEMEHAVLGIFSAIASGQEEAREGDTENPAAV